MNYIISEQQFRLIKTAANNLWGYMEERVKDLKDRPNKLDAIHAFLGYMDKLDVIIDIINDFDYAESTHIESNEHVPTLKEVREKLGIDLSEATKLYNSNKDYVHKTQSAMSLLEMHEGRMRNIYQEIQKSRNESN